MLRSFSLALCFMLTGVSLVAQNKEQGRLENAGFVMEEILNLPDSIPQDLLNKAECVIVVPSMTKVAIGIGGSYGRGRWSVAPVRALTARGVHRRCMRSTAAASACNWVHSPLTSCSWS
jgi:lipid-binding SYLF domain-containing protein